MSFFDSQPTLPGNPSVFILRTIMHDWSDKYANKILTNLRAKATSETRLLVLDSVIDFACPTTVDDIASGVRGAERSQPPAPLLANLGQANVMSYGMDLVVRIFSSKYDLSIYTDFRGP